MGKTKEDPKLVEIQNWIEKLRKLLDRGGGKAIVEAMPGLQKELQALAGVGSEDIPIAAQLKTVLSLLAEGMQSGEDAQSQPPLEELLKLKQLLGTERRTLQSLLKELEPVLTSQEMAMFQMTLEMVDGHSDLQQFESALALLNQASLKAWEIVDEGRSPKNEEDESPQVDLAPLVQAATEGLGKLLAPWAPLLTAEFQVQSALFASLLSRCLQEQAYGSALGLINAWSEAVQDLPRQLREQLLLELAQHEVPEAANEREAREVLLVREKILQILSNSELQADDIQAAQQLLDRLPALMVEAQNAVDERLRLDQLWQMDLIQARKAMRRELDRIDAHLHPQVRSRLNGKLAWTRYLELLKCEPDGNYKDLKQDLDMACEGVTELLKSIALALRLETGELVEKGTSSDDELDGPHEIDSIDALLRACPPVENEDSRSYLQREDVIVHLGDNWLSYGARGELSNRLDAGERSKKQGKGSSKSSDDEEKEGWDVIDDDPQVYFTESAALDKAWRIIQKVKSGSDPRVAATEEGCSTPTWYGNMLEIRLTQGGTQLRLIAHNRGNHQLAFTEVKSFHAPGDKKAGKLSNYI